jgi:hypothetical protein
MSGALRTAHCSGQAGVDHTLFIVFGTPKLLSQSAVSPRAEFFPLDPVVEKIEVLY